MNRLCVLVVGNLSDGFRFIGPFEDFDAAAQFSEGVDADNWVATLEPADLPTAFTTAAAPELLAACKLLVALEDGDVCDADTRWKQARRDMRTAIAIAEGRDA